jgi:tRNA pseudouridine38-40 synthase
LQAFKLTIAYDGTGLVGWQRQARGVSVQGVLEDALRELDGAAVTVIGAGRTDAGVHALAQTAHVHLSRVIDSHVLRRAVNARLPPAVRVTCVESVPLSFNARFDARMKRYRYRIWNAEVLSPFERPYAWHLPAPRLDVAAMARAAARFEGRHDFAAFQGTGSAALSTVRVVHACEVTRRGPLIRCEVTGEGFLRHMVRAMAGTLVEVGRGRREPGWIDEVIASGTRGLAGQTAPACGLFLVAVHYAPPAGALAAER